MVLLKERGGGEEETFLSLPLPPLSFFGCRSIFSRCLDGWMDDMAGCACVYLDSRHFTHHGEEKNTSNVLLLNTVIKRSSLTTDRK